MSKSKNKNFVCTTYVANYTTFVGQSHHICSILYHIRGILYHKREFPGNPYTVKFMLLKLDHLNTRIDYSKVANGIN